MPSVNREEFKRIVLERTEIKGHPLTEMNLEDVLDWLFEFDGLNRILSSEDLCFAVYNAYWTSCD